MREGSVDVTALSAAVDGLGFHEIADVEIAIPREASRDIDNWPNSYPKLRGEDGKRAACPDRS